MGVLGFGDSDQKGSGSVTKEKTLSGTRQPPDARRMAPDQLLVRETRKFTAKGFYVAQIKISEQKVGASASPHHHVSASFFSREFTCFNHGQFDSHCSSAPGGVWLISLARTNGASDRYTCLLKKCQQQRWRRDTSELRLHLANIRDWTLLQRSKKTRNYKKTALTSSTYKKRNSSSWEPNAMATKYSRLWLI